MSLIRKSESFRQYDNLGTVRQATSDILSFRMLRNGCQVATASTARTIRSRSRTSNS